MGWLSGWSSKRELVRHLTQPWQDGPATVTCLKHCWRGNCFSGVLWAVFERAEPEKAPHRFIVAFLMKKYGGGRPDWGYKDVTETMGPCETSCPLGYLALVPDPKTEFSTPWRERVRAYHERQSRKFRVGQTYALEGCKVDTITITQLRPLVGVGPDGVRYRVPRQHVTSEDVGNGPKFSPGQVVATPGAIQAMQESGQDAAFFLSRHLRGDWGECLDDGDRRLNDDAVKNGDRILSAYLTLKGERLWAITEASRECTTLLKPDEY